MFLGSNNSLTYLKSSNKWFGDMFNLGKCQDIGYEDQYLYHGVRMFDFKLSVDHKHHIIVKNDIYEYPIHSFYEILDFLNKKGDTIVLLTLNLPNIYHTGHMLKLIEKKFADTCRIIESIYDDIAFCGGYTQYSNQKIYEFTWEKEHGMPIVVYPSKYSRWYRFVTKWCPSLIKKLNKRYIKQFKDRNVYLMLNYVNKR